MKNEDKPFVELSRESTAKELYKTLNGLSTHIWETKPQPILFIMVIEL